MKVKFVFKSETDSWKLSDSIGSLVYNKIYDAILIEDNLIDLIYQDDTFGSGIVKGLFMVTDFGNKGNETWFIDVTQEERNKTIDKILDI